MGIFVFCQKETGAERIAMATVLRVSFCFFCDTHLWCQVLRTMYRLFSILPLFTCKQFDITYLICITENLNISKTKKKNAILVDFERPFK